MKNIALIAAVLFASPGFALAEEVTTVRGPSPSVEHVPYQSSELATAAGIRAVKTRVSRAANRVCYRETTGIVLYDQKLCVLPARREGYAQLDRLVALRRANTLATEGTITIRAR